MGKLTGIVGVVLTPLAIIAHELGDILHAMKCDDEGFNGFGEAYFSQVHFNAVKAWKRHRKMTLNLVVPIGSIRIVLVSPTDVTTGSSIVLDLTLSRDNYQRLTVPPGIWFGFQGRSRGTNLLLNLANIPHTPEESEQLPKNSEAIPFHWDH